jgi:hypothetical protein
MNLNLTIAIDDVNPKKGWRIFGDKTEKYLFDLNKEFGAKFTLFIPSNYHGETPISENKEWVTELKSSGIFELAAHGHFHQTSDKDRFGEMEFVDMSEPECEARVEMLLEEWDKVNYKPEGWRNPGWMCQSYGPKYLSPHLKYAALHYQHNHNLKWGCKMYFGADGIHEDNIEIHNDNCIMFQSHIAGEWNDNIWSERNFNQMRISLEHLVKNADIKFKTLNEL